MNPYTEASHAWLRHPGATDNPEMPTWPTAEQVRFHTREAEKLRAEIMGRAISRAYRAVGHALGRAWRALAARQPHHPGSGATA